MNGMGVSIDANSLRQIAGNGWVFSAANGGWEYPAFWTVTLIVQALLFGDGGITAIGANCLNIAFVMPFVGYAVYRWLTGLLLSRKARAAAAAIGAWLGLTAAAFTTALMLGIQPLLHAASDGRALYAPYPLSVTVPVLALEHLAVFGVVEALLTGLVVYHLQGSRSAWVLQRALSEVPR